MNYVARNVIVNVPSNDYELLTDVNIKKAIMLRMNLTTDEQYSNYLSDGIVGLQFAILSDAAYSVNYQPYEANTSITKVPNYFVEPISEPVKSIRIRDAWTSVCFYFNII